MASLTTIVHYFLPTDGAKSVLGLPDFFEGDVGWERAYVMAGVRRLVTLSSNAELAKSATRVEIRECLSGDQVNSRSQEKTEQRKRIYNV